MHTHTTGPHMQAYVCIHILVSRNLNSSFMLLFPLLSSLFLCYVCLLMYARLGFSLKVSYFDAMPFIYMFMHDAVVLSFAR